MTYLDTSKINPSLPLNELNYSDKNENNISLIHFSKTISSKSTNSYDKYSNINKKRLINKDNNYFQSFNYKTLKHKNSLPKDYKLGENSRSNDLIEINKCLSTNISTVDTNNNYLTLKSKVSPVIESIVDTKNIEYKYLSNFCFDIKNNYIKKSDLYNYTTNSQINQISLKDQSEINRLNSTLKLFLLIEDVNNITNNLILVNNSSKNKSIDMISQMFKISKCDYNNFSDNENKKNNAKNNFMSFSSYVNHSC